MATPFQKARHVVARKTHRCAGFARDCYKPDIQPGERYIRLIGRSDYWTGFQSFALHEDCMRQYLIGDD